MADRGFDVPNVFMMDETQMTNIMNWLNDERQFTLDCMRSDSDASTWETTYLKAAMIFNEAAIQLNRIMNSPLIELSANGIGLFTIRACAIWDGEVAVNFHPTEEFSAYMKEYIRENIEMLQLKASDPIEEVVWSIVGSPIGEVTRVKEQGLIPMTTPGMNIDAEGLMRDYGLWVGLASMSPEPPAIDNVTPLVYIQEFMEACYQPEEQHVRTFLYNFYTQQTVDDFCEEIAWDNEAYD